MVKSSKNRVSIETAKLLKEVGFNEMCDCCYGLSVRHNGREIDEDEEYELKSEGLADEIEYVDGAHLYHMWCRNNDYNSIYSCPTQEDALEWVRENLKIYVIIDLDNNGKWFYKSFTIPERFEILSSSARHFGKYVDATENALFSILRKTIELNKKPTNK